MKFKVGDKVRAVTEDYGVTNQEYEWMGKVTSVYTYTFSAETIYSTLGNIGKVYNNLNYEDFELVNQSKIVILTDGETVTAKKYEGKEVIKSATAKCHPDDEFNFDIGAKIAFDRLTEQSREDGKFKVGDYVKVVYPGQLYATYADWVFKNANEYSVYYSYGTGIYCSDNTTYKIVVKAPHERKEEGMLYLIQETNGLKNCYLINERGLVKVNK